MLRKKGVARARTHTRPSTIEMFKEPECLVGVGFRCWLAGYDTCDIGCWESGWNHYATKLGTDQAKLAITELSCWVRAVRENSGRRLAYYPHGCAGFCRDECLAISMIAAAQHNACPALRACAFALLDCDPLDPVIESAGQFGACLSGLGINLSNRSICDVAGVRQSLQGECPITRH